MEAASERHELYQGMKDYFKELLMRYLKQALRKVFPRGKLSVLPIKNYDGIMIGASQRISSTAR